MPTKLWETTPSKAPSETALTGSEITGLWDDQFMWRNTNTGNSNTNTNASIETHADLPVRNSNFDIKIEIAGVEDFNNSLM